MSGTSRVLARQLRCQHCQWRALNTFAGFAGLTVTAAQAKVPIRSHPALRPFATARSLRLDEEKPYSTQPPMLVDEAESEAEAEAEAEAESDILNKIATIDGLKAIEDGPPPSLDVSTSQDPSVPWYLQTQEQSNVAAHISRQQLPELPEHPPSSLQAMIEHLFTEIGLDDLRILDLRAMDPPPALGSNLIMVVGTARSEKHLHVSADRFCRWLRSAYKLRPYADGLLGRNELKIRLKRKAKRMKLLGSRGVPQEDTDDGIHTGWVCVNVGAIEEQVDSRQQELDAAGIVGFSDAQDGVHLVVQMMTEEKREELDLEKLWLDALTTQHRKDQKVARSLEEFQENAVEAVQVGSEVSLTTSNADIVSYSLPSRAQGSTRRRARGYHTNSKLVTGTDTSQSFAFNWHEKLSGAELSGSKHARRQWHDLEERGMMSRLEAFWKVERPRLSEPYESSLETLKALSEEGAIEVIGRGPYDLNSTPFLTKCFSQIKTFPDESYWICRIWVAFYGMFLGHPKFSPTRVQGLFSMMESELVQPSQHFYRLALEAFAPCSQDRIDPVPEFPKTSPLTLAFIVSAMSRLQSLNSNLGLSFVFERLYLARLRHTLGQPNSENPPAHVSLERELKHLRAVTSYYGSIRVSEGFHLNALDMLTGIGSGLEPFLAHWSTIPIYSGTRTTAQYTLFFNHLARRGDPRIIERVLEDTIEMMSLEEPQVVTKGDLAAAILRCLEVVKPNVQELASLPYGEQARYAKIWRRYQEEVEDVS